MKRFWKIAQISSTDDGHAVMLDARPLILPGGNPFTTPFLLLARAIADEWAGAPQDFSPEDLPLTRLTGTAHDRVPAHRADIIRQLAGYGLNDLLCYRAESPDGLVSRQTECWDHWLNWVKANHGLALLKTTGIVPMDQPPGTSALLTEILSSLSNSTIAALGVIIPATGSLVLGLALKARALAPQDACAVAFLDELWQEEQWGADREALARRAKIATDIATSTRFMSLCSP